MADIRYYENGRKGKREETAVYKCVGVDVRHQEPLKHPDNGCNQPGPVVTIEDIP